MYNNSILSIILSQFYSNTIQVLNFTKLLSLYHSFVTKTMLIRKIKNEFYETFWNVNTRRNDISCFLLKIYLCQKYLFDYYKKTFLKELKIVIIINIL